MCCKADDQVLVQVTDELTVTITLKEYRELLEKSIRLDTIADSIRQKVNAGASSLYSKIDDELVLMLTGTLDYQKPDGQMEQTQQPEQTEEKDE